MVGMEGCAFGETRMRFGFIGLALASMVLLQAANADPKPFDEALNRGYAAVEEGRSADARAAFRQACDAGSSDGCRQLASGLRFDADIAPDEAAAAAAEQRAVNLDIEACEAGDAYFCKYTADNFLYGTVDTPANPERAAYYQALAIAKFSEKCDAGDANACRDASYFYTAGAALEDPEKAALFEKKAGEAEAKACDRGDAYTCLYLAENVMWAKEPIPGISGTGEGAARALLARGRPAIDRGCASGEATACLAALEWRYHGYGAPADPEGALAQADSLCRAGSPISCFYRTSLMLSDPIRLKASDLELAMSFLDEGCAMQQAKGAVTIPKDGTETGLEDICAIRDSFAAPENQNYFALLKRGFDGLKTDCEARDANACGNIASAYAYGPSFRFNPNRDALANPYFRKQLQYACEEEGGDRCVDYASAMKNGLYGLADPAAGEAMLTAMCDGGALGAAFACTTLGNDILYGPAFGTRAATEPAAEPSVTSAAALPFFEKACALGDENGCYTVQSLKDPYASAPAADAMAPAYTRTPEELAALEARCQQSDKDACYDLGNAYNYGEGVTFDVNKATGYYRAACYLKHAAACGVWGDVARYGETDGAMLSAASAYREGCALGLGWTCLEAGFLILDGAFGGVPAPQQAFWEFDNGCKLGHQDSCLQAGISLDRGDPGYTDPNQALAYFEVACNQGYTRGCGLAGLMFSAGRSAPGGEVTVVDASSGQFRTQTINGLSQSPGAARRFYELGCPMPLPDGVFDDPLSCTNLGVLHSSGALGAADPVTALRYFERACSIGEPAGCFNAGVYYETGRGTASISVRAVEFYRNACDIGYTDGCTALSALE